MSSTVVDNRVVEFSFDNKKFESNVKTSLDTLDKFKNSLNFDGVVKNFEQIDTASKNVKIGHLNDSVETVKTSFSTLQVVAVTALANITNSVVNLGKKILGSIIQPITQGGWNRALNIENAKFQLEGLGVAWADIEDDINYGVKDTAYGLDSAAKVASQLVASQVKLGDEMKSALRGISGVAAMTNSTYDDIGRIFTTVAGNGRLMGDQLLQLSSRGLNAAAILGEALGKTEAEVRNMVSHGEIDFNTFAQAMDNAFGQHAKDANKTFTGAMSNVKSAFARIGANFAAPLMQNAIEVFNTIRILVNNINKALQPVYDIAAAGMEKAKDFLVAMFDSESPLEKFQNRIKATGTDWDSFKELVVGSANEYYGAFSDISFTVEGFDDALMNGKFTSEMFLDAINSLLTPTGEVAKSLGVAADSAGEFHDIVQRVIRGDFDTGAQRIQALADAGYDAAYIQELVNQQLEGTAVALSELSDEQIEQTNLTKEQKELLISLREELKNGTISVEDMVAALNKPTKVQLSVGILVNLLKSVQSILGAVKKGWDRVFGKKNTNEGFYKLLESLKEFTEKLILSDEKADKLADTFAGLFAIVDLLAEIIGAAFSEGLRVINDLFGETDSSILDLTGSIGDNIVKFKEWVDESEVVKTIFDKIGDGIITVVEQFKEWFKKLEELPGVSDAITTFKDHVSDLTDKIKAWFETNKDLDGINFSLKDSIEKVKDKTKEWFDAFKDLPLVQDTIQKIKDFVNPVIDKIRELFDKAASKVKDFFGNFDPITLEDIKERFEEFKDKVSEAFKNPKEALENFIQSLKDTRDKVKSWLDNINFDFDQFKEEVITVFKSIGEFVQDNAAGLIIMGFGAALLGGSYYIYEGMLTIANAVSFVKPFNTLSNALFQYAKAQKIKAFGEGIKMFASAIVTLVVAVGMLSRIKDAEANIKLLIKLMIWMGVIFGALIGLTSLLSKKGVLDPKLFDTSMTQLVVAIIGMVGAIWILAQGLKVLAQIDTKGLMQNIEAIWPLLATLAGIFAGVTLYSVIPGKGNPTELAAPILAFAAALYIIVQAMKKIADMKPESIQKGLTVVKNIIQDLMFGTLLAGFGGANTGTAATILAFAAAMLLIYKAMKKFANMDYGEMNKGMTVIKQMVGQMGILMAESMLAGKNAGQAGLLMLGFGASLIMISKAMEMISGIDENSLKTAEGVIGTIIGMMSAVILVSGLAKRLGGSGKTGFAGLAAVMIGLSAALLVAVGAIWVVSKIDESDVWRATAIVDSLLGMFAIIIAASKNVGKGRYAIGQLIVMAAMLLELGVALYVLSGLPWQNVLASAGAITLVMLALAGMLYVMKNTNFKQDQLKKIVGAVGILIVLIGAIGSVLWGMSALNVQNALVNAGALAILLTVMAGALWLMSKSEFEEGQLNDDLKAMLGLALVMGALVGVLGLLEACQIDASLNNVAALSILLATMAIALFVMSKSEFKENQLKRTSGAMGALTVVMALLGGVLLEIQKMGIDASLKNVRALSILLEAMAIALFIMSKSEFKEDQMLETAAGMGILLIWLAGLGAVLWEIEALGIDASIKNVLLLSTLLEAMAIALFIMSKSEFKEDQMLETAAGMAVLLIVVAGLGVVLWELEALGIDASIKNVLALSILLEAMAIAMIPLSIAGKLGYGAELAGVLGLGTLLIAMGALFAGFGKLQEKFPELQNFLDTGIPLVEQIAEGIGRIFGNLIGGFIDRLAESLPGLGLSLSAFGLNLIPFITSAKLLNDEVIAGVMNLAEIMLILSASDLISGIASLFGADKTTFSDFGEEINNLAPYIVSFAETVSGIGETDVTTAANAAKTLASIYDNLPLEGGIIGDIFGEADMSKFGEGIGAFGEGIKKFQDSLEGTTIDEELITSAANAGGAMAELETKLKNHGGVWQDVFGDSDLTTFGEQLPKFGDAIKQFQESLPEEVKSELIEDTANAAGAMASLESGLKNHNGVWQKVFGDSDLTTFGSQLESFATAFKTFQEALPETVKSDIIEQTTNAAGAMAALESGLKDHSGLFQLFTGDATLTDFGTNLQSFGTGFKNYYDSIKDITEWTNFELVIDAVMDLSDLDKYLEENNTYGDYITTMGTFLGTFGPAYSTYYDKIKGMFTTKLANSTAELVSLIKAFKDSKDGEGITAFAAGLSSLADDSLQAFVDVFYEGASTDAVDAANTFIDGFITAINTKAVDLVESFGTTMTDFLDSIAAYYPSFESKGSGLMDNLAAGITSNESVSTSISTLVTSIGGSFDAHVTTFTSYGKDLIDGMALGITNKTAYIKLKFSTLMTNLKSSFDAYIDDFTDYGKDLGNAMGDGLGGISDLGDVATTAITNIKNQRSDMYSAGSYLIDGLVEGLTGTASYNKVSRAGRQVGWNLLIALRESLDINSPSKEAYDIGDYFVLGFTNALYDSDGTIRKAAYMIGDETIGYTMSMLSTIGSLIDDGVDINPTITPVLDLTNIQNGIGTMNSMFGNGDYMVGSAYDLAASAQAGFNYNKESQDATVAAILDLKRVMESAVSVPANVYNNTFNVTGDNPAEIADEISDIFQHDIDRGGAVWA